MFSSLSGIFSAIFVLVYKLENMIQKKGFWRSVGGEWSKKRWQFF